MNWIKNNNNRYSLECNNIYKEDRIKCENNHGMNSQVKLIIIDNKKAALINEYSIMSNSIVLFSLRDKIIQFYLYGDHIDSNNGDNFFNKMMESFRIIE